MGCERLCDGPRCIISLQRFSLSFLCFFHKDLQNGSGGGSTSDPETWPQTAKTFSADAKHRQEHIFWPISFSANLDIFTGFGTPSLLLLAYKPKSGGV